MTKRRAFLCLHLLLLLFIDLYSLVEIDMAKKRVTFNIDEDLLDLAKDMVVWLQSKGVRITLSNFVEDAIRERIHIEMLTRHVKKIPRRKRELSRGRLIT